MLYLWIKAFHIISVISWMAGMLYLPRLFVYHRGVKIGGDQDRLFQKMECRLLKWIMNPAMILTYLFGIWMVHLQPYLMKEGWMHTKLLLIFLMTIVHMLFARYRKEFIQGEARYSPCFYKILNEIPTILMILIVILVIVKPF